MVQAGTYSVSRTSLSEGDSRQRRQFASNLETIVEHFERRIPVAGAHRRHVQHTTDVGASARQINATPQSL
jgi:hypothetical protein